MITWSHLHLPRFSAGERNCISVKDKGQRVRYVSDISMKDVTFFVSAAGRERCLRTGVRNVHAWVIGERVNEGINSDPVFLHNYRRAIYDPWKGDSFVWADTLTPVHRAATVYLSGKNVYILEES